MSFLQEIQKDLEEQNIQPENFKDRIIFMSMFNDILWKSDDQNCISNAENVKNYAKKFLPRHWTFGVQGRKRDGVMTHGGQWDRTANKMVQQFKETRHSIFTSISALSRGILKQKRGKSTIHFNGDSVKTQLLFQTVHSVNQISVNAAVTDWCCQFGLTNEEKEQVAVPVDNGILTMVEPEEVEMLLPPPSLALGNKMQGGASFRTWEKRVQLTQLCERTLFQYRVTARNCYQIRPDDDDGMGKNLLLHAENLRVLDPM